MNIVLATPVQDRKVGSEHHASCWQLMREPGVTLLDPKISYDDDLVRARSRCVHKFLETSGDALLLVDSDIKVSIPALRGMIAHDVDCIGATYPRKHVDEWGRCRDFVMRTEPAKIVDGKASVQAIGMGFVLLRRPLLVTMVKDYAEQLTDWGDGVPIVMLFMLMWSQSMRAPNNPVLLPEDYSFCQRVRQHTDVWLYCGEGSPVEHEGHHVFRGKAEDVHAMPQPIQAPPATYVGLDDLEHVWGDDIG